eukprot:2608447-Rhodomonas_salina.1
MCIRDSPSPSLPPSLPSGRTNGCNRRRRRYELSYAPTHALCHVGTEIAYGAPLSSYVLATRCP